MLLSKAYVFAYGGPRREIACLGAIATAYRCATDAFELARNAYHMYQRSDRGEINILGGKTAIYVSQRIQG